MEFQLSYFKSWKMMLWKCCTQYASKFGKLSSGHMTGKGEFLFHSQRKAIPKNAQTTTQLHSSHMLVKWCSKFSKPGFSNMWTMNFQIFAGFRKGRGSRNQVANIHCIIKKARVPEKHLFLLYWLCQSLWLCRSQNKLWKILKAIGIPDHLTCLLRSLNVGQKATVRTGHGTTDWFQIGRGVHQGYILSPCLFNLYAE